jgi:hypothetical protein
MAFNHTFKYLKSGKEVVETRNISATKAIRFNCMDCSGGYMSEVKGCKIQLCPLWPFRMGKSRVGIPTGKPFPGKKDRQGSESGEEGA